MYDYIVNTVKSEIYKNYEIEVIKIINNTFLFGLLNTNDNNAYFNGYIVLPKTSKFYEKHFDDINEKIEIHGGFTFSDFVDDKYKIGFDTIHYFDNENTQNVDFVLNELKNAVDQIIQQELKYDVEKVIKKELSNIVEQIVAKELGNKIDKKK